MAARWSHNPKVGRSILSCFRWPQFIDLRLLSSRHCRFHTAPRGRHPGANISVLKNSAQEVLFPRCFGKYAKIKQTFRSGGNSAVGSIRSHSPKLQDTGNSIPPPGGGRHPRANRSVSITNVQETLSTVFRPVLACTSPNQISHKTSKVKHTKSSRRNICARNHNELFGQPRAKSKEHKA